MILLTALRWSLALVLVTMVASKDVDDPPPIPEIWNAVADSFDSDVMVTMADLAPGASFLVDERYDITDQMGSLGILDHGKFMKYNYYTKTDQSFLVQGTKCSHGTLEKHPGYSMYGWFYTSGNSKSKDDPPVGNFVFGPSALLKITDDYRDQIIYIGVEDIRNITANHWQLTLETGYVIEYYFATDNWMMPYGLRFGKVKLQNPLQVIVRGDEGNPWDSKVAKFKQTVIYDYIDFQPYVLPDDMREFTVERGLDCPNRLTLDPKQTTPPDPVPAIKVHMEAVTNRSDGYPGISFKAWLHFEASRQLMRITLERELPQSTTSTMTNVEDMATGVEYSMDMYTGDCFMKTWSQKDLALLVGAELADVIMADQKNLFKLDDKYIFTGYDETRSIMTSRWSATRNDIDSSVDPGKKRKKVVVDYQFLSKYVWDIGEYTTAPLPARIDMTIYKDDNVNEIEQVQTLNLLNFDTGFETWELNPFDVRDCFDKPVQRSWFRIFFKGGWAHGAAQNQDLFKKEIIDRLTEGAKISYVRVPTVELDHDELYVYAHVLVLEPADYLLQFQDPKPEKPWIHDTQIPYSISDDGICAAMCMTHKKTGFECRSFFECTGQDKNCYVSNSKAVQTPSVDVPECQHYILTTNNPDFQQPNIGVFLYLNDKTSKQDFNFSYSYKDEFGIEHEGLFEGSLVDDEAYPGDPVFFDLITHDFHIIKRHARLQDSFTSKQITASYAACRDACNMASGFDCQSFSYCYDKQLCSMSEKVETWPVDLDEIVADSDCVIISRRYKSDYTSMQGAFYQSDPKETIPDVMYGERCAYLCDNRTDFTCRSFDICYETEMCYLYVERSIDIPDEKINHSIPLCDHFERDSLVDFKKHPHQVLDGYRDRYIDGVTVKECADICEQEPEFGCNGFDYCAPSGSPNTCFLTSANYNDDGVVIHNKPECDHYSREYYDGQDRNHYAHSKTSDYKYGPGAMAGLGVSMLVVSVALTLVAVYAYNTKRS